MRLAIRLTALIFLLLAACAISCKKWWLVVWPEPAALCSAGELYLPAVPASMIPGLDQGIDQGLYACSPESASHPARFCTHTAFLPMKLDPDFGSGDAISFPTEEHAESAYACCVTPGDPYRWVCHGPAIIAPHPPVARVFDIVGNQLTPEQIEQRHPGVFP